MVSVSISGKIVSEVGYSANPNVTGRAAFLVESGDSGSRPLRFSVFAFGTQAKRAVNSLKPGVRVHLFGKMEVREGENGITVALSGFEVQDGGQANGN